MGNIHTTGPNEALIVSGGCAGGSERKVIVVGGWAWAWWCVSGEPFLLSEERKQNHGNFFFSNSLSVKLIKTHSHSFEINRAICICAQYVL